MINLNEEKIKICWTPGHCGINGNEQADREAKRTDGIEVQLPLDYKQLKTRIKNVIDNARKQRWQQANQKLKVAKPCIGPIKKIKGRRREEVVARQFRLGHTWPTHRHILEGNEPPECELCHLRLTVEHIVLCPLNDDLFTKGTENTFQAIMRTARAGAFRTALGRAM